jgi:hypothetical protein
MLSGCGYHNAKPYLYVTQSSLPNVVFGNPYSATLTATNGVAPYTFSFVSGTLPTGLTFTPGTSNATIAGTPTTSGSYTFTVGVKDSSGEANIAIYTIGVEGLQGQYFFNEQYYDADLTATVTKASSSSKGHGWMNAKMLAAAAEHPVIHHVAPRIKSAMARFAHKGQPVPDQGSQNSSVEWGSVAGSFTVDASGNVTGGEYDSSNSFGAFTGTFTGGTYQLNPDGSGTLELQLNGSSTTVDYFLGAHNLNSTTFAFQTVSLIEGTTDGTTFLEYGDGQLQQQTVTNTATVKSPRGTLAGTLSGNWVFGLRGETCYFCAQSNQGDLLTAGLFNFDGAGDITNTSQLDITTGFATDTYVYTSGTVGTAPDSYGRTTASLTANTYDSGALPVTYAIYSIDATHAYVISTDQTGASTAPYLYGPLDQQSNLTFLNSTYTGNYVVWGTSEDYQNESVQPDYYSDTQISVFTSDGTGDITSSVGDFNYAGDAESAVALSANYTVDANGRVGVFNNYDSSGVSHDRHFVGNRAKAARVKKNAIPPGGYQNDASYALWMIDATHGFGVQQTYGDYEPAVVTFGQQSGGSFSNSSVSGSYGFGDDFSATSNTFFAAGIITSDGNGNLTGVLGGTSLSTLDTEGTATATYSIDATGRGTANGTGDSYISSTVFYVVNSGQVVATDIDSLDTAPAIVEFNK